MCKTDAAIASPHWDACRECAHYGRSGCNLSFIDLSVHLGDWIICDDYLKNRQEGGDYAG